MSVVCDNVADQLDVTLGTNLTLASGAYSVGLYMKVTTTGVGRCMGGVIGGGGSNSMVRSHASDTARTIGYVDGANVGTAVTGLLTSIDTWYWCVVSNDGSNNNRFRAFADDGSTSTLANATNGFDPAFTTMNHVFLGAAGGGNGAMIGKYANLKIHTGVQWTDAQCRTEGSSYGIQTAGGTDKYCWKLIGVGADTNGLIEMGGVETFTNSGYTADADTPAMLTSGSTFALDDSDGGQIYTVQQPVLPVRCW